MVQNLNSAAHLLGKLPNFLNFYFLFYYTGKVVSTAEDGFVE